jgi:DNA (cytosine-5)-methyltransferase 1
MFRLVDELRPDYVLVENVPGLIVRGLGRILADLASIGFDAEWDFTSIGLQRSERVRLVAYPTASDGHGPGNMVRAASISGLPPVAF